MTFFTNSNVFLSNNSNNPSTRFSCFFLKRGTAKLLFICDRSPKMDPSGRIDPKFCIHCAFGMLIPKICIWRLSGLWPPKSGIWEGHQLPRSLQTKCSHGARYHGGLILEARLFLTCSKTLGLDNWPKWCIWNGHPLARSLETKYSHRA